MWPRAILKDGCRLETPPDYAYCDELGSRFEYRCYTPELEGVWHPQVHRSCAHNAVRGLELRTLGVTPLPTVEGFSEFTTAMREVRGVLRSRVETPQRYSYDQVISSYSVSRLRARYEMAKGSLVSDPIRQEDASVEAFVKAEKLNCYKLSKPRVIMGRSPRYNLQLATFLKPLEHAVYPAFRGWGRMYTRTRLIAKGLNGEERASLLRRKMLSHPNMVCFEVDCKSFEAHLTLSMLREEHGVYRHLFPDSELSRLLRWQEKFRGRFRNGVRYRAKGVRASGDFNTGLGNTLIMCALVVAVGRSLSTRFDFLADGDNAVVFVAQSDLHLWLRELPRLFLSMGHEAEIGVASSEVSGIVFGQSKPLCVNGRWTMVRNPYRVMSNAFCGHQHYGEMRGGLSVLKSVAYCESVLNRGVPVLQAFAHAMLVRLRSVPFVRQGFDLGNYEYQRVVSLSDRWALANVEVISNESRLLFEKSWGISVEEQLVMEASFSVGSLPESWVGVPVDEYFDLLDPWELPLDRFAADHVARLADRVC